MEWINRKKSPFCLLFSIFCYSFLSFSFICFNFLISFFLFYYVLYFIFLLSYLPLIFKCSFHSTCNICTPFTFSLRLSLLFACSILFFSRFFQVVGDYISFFSIFAFFHTHLNFFLFSLISRSVVRVLWVAEPEVGTASENLYIKISSTPYQRWGSNDFMGETGTPQWRYCLLISVFMF